MDQVTAVGLALAALLLGAASPGPSFVVVSRTAVGESRRAGVAVALGLAVVSALFALLALLGLVTLLQQQPGLFHGVALFGGLYLLFLAARLIGHAAEPFRPAAAAPSGGRRGPFLRGLMVQAANPKTIIVYGSVFSALIPALSPAGGVWTVALPPMVLLVEGGWYGLVALVFSSQAMRGFYLAGAVWIDRAAGVVLLLLAVRTLWGALTALGGVFGFGSL
jgi:threonine/homoserine/homoserine lactone efflux protein